MKNQYCKLVWKSWRNSLGNLKTLLLSLSIYRVQTAILRCHRRVEEDLNLVSPFFVCSLNAVSGHRDVFFESDLMISEFQFKKWIFLFRIYFINKNIKIMDFLFSIQHNLNHIWCIFQNWSNIMIVLNILQIVREFL